MLLTLHHFRSPGLSVLGSLTMPVLHCLNGPNSLTLLILTLVDFVSILEAPGKSSPPTFSEVSSLTGHNTLLSTCLVPATLLTNLSNPALQAEHGLPSMKSPEAIAQDLVQIPLNMHGTQAVQKKTNLLSTQCQSDPHCDGQIQMIMVLSQHVVTLIKDLNLFIYNPICTPNCHPKHSIHHSHALPIAISHFMFKNLIQACLNSQHGSSGPNSNNGGNNPGSGPSATVANGGWVTTSPNLGLSSQGNQ